MKKFKNLRSAAGFTLVELIVVIAILGILAGVGTVGYSGYMKSAQKKADQTLVANIIRAIEVGTNSTMFVNDDSFKMGQMAYPVGFVTLSDSGMQVVTSETKMKENEVKEAGTCVFETIDHVLVQNPQTWSSGCAQDTTATYYSVSEGSITYCKTHSPAPAITLSDGQKYVSGYTHKKGSSILGCTFSCGTPEPKYTTYESGKNIVSNQSSLELQKAGTTMCELAYAYQYDSYDGSTTNIDARTSGTLYDSLTAAFGDISDLKLSYNGWVNDEDIDYATFYTAAPNVMEDMEYLSGVLVLGYETLAALGQGDRLGLSQAYHDEEEVLLNVSKLIVETYPTEDAWMAQWNIAHEQLWDGWGFGLPGRETYSAARVGYNTAFASYMDANGLSQYSEQIRNFQSQSIAGVGLPALVCTDAFTNTTAREKLGLSDEAIEQIAALYENYKNSTACEENGRVFYQTIATFNQTSDMAQKQVENGDYDNIYDYYNSYVDEIAGLYSKAQEASAGGIVIIATVEDGDVKCVVSPSAADLRKAQ